MKRIALLTVFFYCCTFAAPQRSYAVIPVAIIAASAIGAAMVTSSVGAYYAKNGHAPEYVSAISGAVASASDYLFQPSHLAAGPLMLVTAASFPAVATYYVGKEAAVGARIQDVIDTVKLNPTDYPDLYELYNSHTVTDVPTYPIGSNLAVNAVITTPDGQRKITSNFSLYDSGAYATGSYITSKIIAKSGGGTPVKIGTIPTTPKTDLYYCNTKIHKLVYTNSTNQFAYYYFANTTSTTDNSSNTPTPGAETTDWSPIKTALSSPTPTIGDDVRKAISKVPPSAQVLADAVPSAGAGEASQPITHAQP